MVVNQFRIVNNDNNKGIIFYFGKVTANSITVSNVSIPAAGQSADNNYIANLGGFKRIISVDFFLFNDGLDKSTDGQNKVILDDQRDYLLDEVIQGFSTSQASVSYTITTSTTNGTKTYTGGIEDINLNEDPSNGGNRIQGTLNLTVGSN
jgi:hypothetical protein